jgi:hypothetical protein
MAETQFKFVDGVQGLMDRAHSEPELSNGRPKWKILAAEKRYATVELKIIFCLVCPYHKFAR